MVSLRTRNLGRGLGPIVPAKLIALEDGEAFKFRAPLNRISIDVTNITSNNQLEVVGSALQLSRDLDCQYKTAFVLTHKLREAMAAETAKHEISGDVEIDGAYFGGYVKPSNFKKDRIDRRLAENQTGKRQAVVIMRERAADGQAMPFVFGSEGEAVPTIRATVEPGSVIHADEASCYDQLSAHYETRRINHSFAYSHDGACTNQAESFFSRLRRAEIGTPHKIAGPYLAAYAREMAWRENNRRVSNGEQYGMTLAATLAHPVSRTWKGYWQRNVK